MLLHAISPAQFRRTSAARMLASKLVYHLGETLRYHGRQRWRYAAGRGQAVLRDGAPQRPRAKAGEPASFAQLLYDAALAYDPQPYDGAVALFQPASRPTVYDFRPGWAEVVRGHFTAYEVSATHWTLLDEANVGQLGTTMNACLMRAQGAPLRRTAAE